MGPYEAFIHASVLDFARAGKGAREIRDLARRLAERPFTVGDFQETDELGRKVEVILVAGYAVTFWVDHAAREIRINNVRAAD